MVPTIQGEGTGALGHPLDFDHGVTYTVLSLTASVLQMPYPQKPEHPPSKLR